MAEIRNQNVKIKAKVFDTDITIKSNIGSNDKKIKGQVSSIPTATTERKGIIRIATDEEALEGIDNSTAITPYTLRLATHYTHEQAIASDVWVIHHNLGKRPSVTVVDTAESEQIPDEKEYNDDNTVTLYFLSEFAGKAYLN